MLSLSRILISDFVVANLFMHSFPGMIHFTRLHLFTSKVLLHEITYTYNSYVATHKRCKLKSKHGCNKKVGVAVMYIDHDQYVK